VLFADLKGSMELLADRDPEEARKLLDPVIERTSEVKGSSELVRLCRAYVCGGCGDARRQRSARMRGGA
jgi:hypothetical protein